MTPNLLDHVNAINIPAAFEEAHRKMHTLVTAGTGAGKSELLKVLVHHYVEHPTAAVVVLDPHGKLVRQLAKFPDLQASGRLVYVEPNLAPDLTVGINPLNGHGLDEDGVAIVAAQLATSLGELVSKLSDNMETLARNCLRVLLEERDATLADLVKLLAPTQRRRNENQPEDKRRAYLIAKGRRHSDELVADFFNIDLDAESFASSKAALRNRILALLSIPSWRAVTCGGPETLDLKAALDQRKVVLVNLEPFGEEGGAALGRLIISMVAAIGRRRGDVAPEQVVPCHVFVDETATMVSPAMSRVMAQLRKFGVHLTMAQQAHGVGFDEDGLKLLSTSVACQIVGSNSRKDLQHVFGDQIPADLPKLGEGEFWMRWGHRAEPVRVQVRSDLVDDRRSISLAAWEAFKASTAASKLYRPAKEPPQPVISYKTAPAASSNTPGLDLPFV